MNNPAIPPPPPDPYARTDRSLHPIDRARRSDPPTVRTARIWGRVAENLSLMAIIVVVGERQAIEWYLIVGACAFVIGLVNAPWSRDRGRDIGIFSLMPHAIKAVMAAMIDVLHRSA